MTHVVPGKTISLEPLAAFYGVNGSALPEWEAVEAGALPEPAGRLLNHEGDMTSRLAEFHGQGIALEVLEKRQNGEVLLRRVVLRGEKDGRVVEYGAIRIHLSVFAAGVREEIVACRRPLGAILRSHGIVHRGRPTGFVRVRSDGMMNEAMGLGGPTWLCGRCNQLLGGEGQILAEVVEILPPAAGSSSE